MLGPQPNLANNAVLAHRLRKVCLDNAFSLIDGHPPTRQRLFECPANYLESNGFVVLQL